MVFAVLSRRGRGKAEGHDKEEESRDLEPQLVSGAADRAARGANPAHDGLERAVASGLPPGDLRYGPNLS